MSNDKSVRLNSEINARQVRLIEEGKEARVVTITEALQAARDAELDLVEISPNAEPPVCRVMDYGKYLFEQNKQKAQQKKKQKQIQIKEVKFRPGTEIADYQVKLRNLIRFLEGGDKVKITLRFRGREISHMELGARLLERIRHDLDNFGVVEQMPKLEGRQMVMMVSPKKK